MTTASTTTSTNGLPAAIYLRMSQDRSGEELGIERQEEDCRAKADELGWEVFDVFTDNDISAYSGKKRPRYQAMLEAIKAGEIKGVIAYHPSRLHRRTRELETYIDLCEKHGVQNQTVAAGLWDLSTATGQMTAKIIGSVDQQESAIKAERITRARQQKAKKGAFSGGARPYGYTKDSSALVPEEATEIKTAVEAVVRGASLRSLVKDLNTRDLTTATGKVWTSKQLKDTLVSARIAGLSTYHGEIVAEAQWPAIVGEDTWRAAVSILTNPARRTNGNAGPGPKWLGSGIYRCGVCGQAALRVSTYGSVADRRRGYRCANPERLAGGHVSRGAEKVDLYVESAIIARLQKPGLVHASIDQDDPAMAATLRTELDVLRTRKDDLVSMFMAGDIDRSQMTTATAEFKVRSEEIEKTLARMGGRSPLAVFDKDRADIPAIWAGLDLDQKRAVLDYLATVTIHKAKRGSGVRFDADSVVIDWKA